MLQIIMTASKSGHLGATEGVTVAGGNGKGSAANQFNVATGITLDASGNLYVADYNNRIQKWEPGATEGVTVAGGNGKGSAANQLDFPRGIALDASGNIYIVDMNNHRIQKLWALYELDKCAEIPPSPLSKRDTDEDGVNDTDEDGVNDNLDQCPNTSIDEFNSVNPNGCSVKQIETKAFAHLIKNKINEFQSPDEKPLTFDEIISRISVSESYGDYLYSFSYKKKSSPYLYRMYYYHEDFIEEVYLNEKLIREEVGNTIYTYDSSGNVEEKAYHKN